MTARARQEIVGYWIIPVEPARDFFVSSIRELATRFDAPLFEPHITVYAAGKQEENPEDTLQRSLAGCEPFRLLCRDVQCSDEFTKTVFVQFEPSRRLDELSRALQCATVSQEKYELNPHLSLIYSNMPAAQRVELAAAISLPFREVLFDLAKAVICPAPIKTRADVEAWRSVATQSLRQPCAK